MEVNDKATFIARTLELRSDSIQKLDTIWAEKIKACEDGETPDLRNIAVEAIDHAIGGALDLFSNHYPELVTDVSVQTGEDGRNEIIFTLAGDIRDDYFAAVNN